MKTISVQTSIWSNSRISVVPWLSSAIKLLSLRFAWIFSIDRIQKCLYRLWIQSLIYPITYFSSITAMFNFSMFIAKRGKSLCFQETKIRSISSNSSLNLFKRRYYRAVGRFLAHVIFDDRNCAISSTVLPVLLQNLFLRGLETTSPLYKMEDLTGDLQQVRFCFHLSFFLFYNLNTKLW